MASINRSDYTGDRRGPVGKGDHHSNGFNNYRNGVFWKRSLCCVFNVDVAKNGEGLEYYVCKHCGRPCDLHPHHS